jgi:F-type H+-transporting ATPase subunit b
MDIIDPRQLATQVLGFIIVLWILGRYAWPKVLGFIEARQKGIEADLRHASDEREQAAKLREELDRELRGIEARARARIQEAVNEGQRVATEIKASAQRDVTLRLQRLDEEIEQEREKARETLREDLVRLAIEAAEKVLRQKLDGQAQRRLVEEFIADVGTAPAARAAR